MFNKKKEYPELASDKYLNTNILNLDKKGMVYLIHMILSVVIIFFTMISPYRRKIHIVVSLVVLLLAFIMLLQIYGFEDIMENGFEIAKPKDKTINWIWNDGTTKWYKDIHFFILWIFALFYGLNSLKYGRSILNFPLDIKSNEIKYYKFLFILPLFGFIYYFMYIVINQGALIKPLPDRLYNWEAPLAAYFSLSFIPFLMLFILKDKLLDNNNIFNKIITNRLLVFACFYVFIWRLNGGLFLNKEQHTKLKHALDEYDKKK